MIQEKNSTGEKTFMELLIESERTLGDGRALEIRARNLAEKDGIDVDKRIEVVSIVLDQPMGAIQIQKYEKDKYGEITYGFKIDSINSIERIKESYLKTMAARKGIKI
jgi:hypothetical protein